MVYNAPADLVTHSLSSHLVRAVEKALCKDSASLKIYHL